MRAPALAGVMIALALLFTPTSGRTQSAGERTVTDTAAVGAQLSVEYVEGTDPWVMASAHRTFVPAWGVGIARLTAGERFELAGVQGEVEAYPRIGRLAYLYAAAALSPHEKVFVPFRGALELFGSSGAGLELSAGARVFRSSGESIIAYTGSIGGYEGNYWAAFRPYVVRESRNFSTTGQLSFRRFWAGRYDYVGFYVSGTKGVDPVASDPGRLQRDAALTSFSARIERLRPVRDGRARVGVSLGAESEEVVAGSRRLHLALSLRFERLLK